MNWFKKSFQTGSPGDVLLGILVEAGKSPSQLTENIYTRFSGIPRDTLEQALSYAYSKLGQFGYSILTENQKNIIGQLQTMITGVDVGQPEQQQSDEHVFTANPLSPV